MQDATFYIQLAVLVAYVIGGCVVIKTLNKQVRAQTEIINNMKANEDSMKRTVDLIKQNADLIKEKAELLKVEEFKKYVEMTNDNIRMEQKKIREKELEEQRKVVEQELNSKAKEGVTLLLNEMRALYTLSYRLLSEDPENTNIDTILDEMTKESLSKSGLLEARKKAKEYWQKLWQDWSNGDPKLSKNMMAAVLLRMDVNKKP